MRYVIYAYVKFSNTFPFYLLDTKNSRGMNIHKDKVEEIRKGTMYIPKQDTVITEKELDNNFKHIVYKYGSVNNLKDIQTIYPELFL